MAPPPIRELTLARVWAESSGLTRLTASTGETFEIIFRGTWTHGFGPDFEGAIIASANGLTSSGAIEIHVTTSGWRQHGHHLDPRYNDVILHVVGIDDGAVTRRADGTIVPVAAIGLNHPSSLDEQLDWTRVGGDVCAADLWHTSPDALRDAVKHLGDQRLFEKAARFETAFTLMQPAQALWVQVLDALGYTENRGPMTTLGAILPIRDVDSYLRSVDDRFASAAALLLGTGGFLPLSPLDADIANLTGAAVRAIEDCWFRAVYRPSTALMPAAWETRRVRPANHPVVRLLTAAALITEFSSGLVSGLLSLLDEPSSATQRLIDIAMSHGCALGADRSVVILANVIVPFAIALAEQNQDDTLTERAIQVWDALAASAHNRSTRSAQLQITGGPALRGIGERGMQGLIHLHRERCTPRRCFECPIARLVVQHDR